MQRVERRVHVCAGRPRRRIGRATMLCGLVVWSCLGWLGCATGGGGAGAESAACRPEFPYQGGWLGGDGAYSIGLHSPDDPVERPTLWLFGDSFVSDRPQTDRVGASFVHNTVALSRCGKSGFEIEYHWRHGPDGEPTAFFDPGLDDSYWWLFGGFVYDGALYVGLLELEPALAGENALQMPFRMVGMRLARIDEPGRPPSQWKPQIARLSHSDRAFPGAAMVVEGDYVYFFTFTPLVDGHQPRLLSRLPLAVLADYPADLSARLETWTGDGGWEPGLQPERAMPLMNDNASEMSVERESGPDGWIAVYGSPIQVGEAPSTGDDPALSGRIYLRRADRLTGPWSERRVLYEIPEIEAVRGGGGDPNTICYAAKAHAGFQTPGHLLVTYVCNLRTRPGEDPYAVLQRLQRNMDLYRPEVVDLPLPAPPR